MARTRSLLAAGVLALTAASCHWGRKPFDPSVDQSIVTLRVDNESFADVTVFAMDGVSSYRIGRVLSRTTLVFKLPATLLVANASLQLFVRPVAAQAYRLPPVMVVGGQMLALTITDDPMHASVAVVPPAQSR